MKLSVLGANSLSLAVSLAELGNEVLLWDPDGTVGGAGYVSGHVAAGSALYRSYWNHLSSLRLRLCREMRDALCFGRVHIVPVCNCAAGSGHWMKYVDVFGEMNGRMSESRSVVLLGGDRECLETVSGRMEQRLRGGARHFTCSVHMELIEEGDHDRLESFVGKYCDERAARDGRIRSVIQRLLGVDWKHCPCASLASAGSRGSGASDAVLTKIVLIYLPRYRGPDEPPAYGKVFSSQVDLINPVSVLDGAHYWSDVTHVNAEGSRRVTDFVADAIVKKGYFGGNPESHANARK